MSIRVEELTPGGQEEYERFVESRPGSLVYHSLAFRDFLLMAVGGRSTILVARGADDRICGVLPWFEREAAGLGKVLNSLPWYGSHGGCLIGEEEPESVREALLAEFKRCAGGEGCLSATIILTHQEEYHRSQYEATLLPVALDHRLGQMTALLGKRDDLEVSLEAVLRQKTRNLVRKALKQGFVAVEADDDESWSFLYNTHVENMEGIGGKPKPWVHFEAMRACIPAARRKLLVAELDGVRVAAMLLLYFNRTVEYITPVIKHEHRSRQPLSFLIWQGMLDACVRGYERWNWGGTWVSQESLHHFKAGWGARDMPYSYLILATEEGRKSLMRVRGELAKLFPFYYTYPFHLLQP